MIPVKFNITELPKDTVVAFTTAEQVVSNWFPFIQVENPLLFNQITKLASGMVTNCAFEKCDKKQNIKASSIRLRKAMKVIFRLGD